MRRNGFNWLCAFPQNIMSLTTRVVRALCISVQLCAREVWLAQGVPNLSFCGSFFISFMFSEFTKGTEYVLMLSCPTTLWKVLCTNTEILPGHSARVLQTDPFLWTKTWQNKPVDTESLHVVDDLSARVVSFASISYNPSTSYYKTGQRKSFSLLPSPTPLMWLQRSTNYLSSILREDCVLTPQITACT